MLSGFFKPTWDIMKKDLNYSFLLLLSLLFCSTVSWSTETHEDYSNAFDYLFKLFETFKPGDKLSEHDKKVINVMTAVLASQETPPFQYNDKGYPITTKLELLALYCAYPGSIPIAQEYITAGVEQEELKKAEKISSVMIKRNKAIAENDPEKPELAQYCTRCESLHEFIRQQYRH